jgi:hypothetical protein
VALTRAQQRIIQEIEEISAELGVDHRALIEEGKVASTSPRSSRSNVAI